MTIENDGDIEALRRIGAIVARVMNMMLDALEPGMTTRELDALGAALLTAQGARSAPQLVYDFPGATCISINEEAAHGIPGDRVIRAGDVVNVDVSAELDGYFADTGGTRVVPPSNDIKDRLCAASREALHNALSQVRAGERINVIGRAIEATARRHEFTVIENLGSHGVGRGLHEEPSFIQGYDNPKDRRLLKEGMVITIEPFLSTRSRFLQEADDGWTLRGEEGSLSAQYEHTLIVTKGEPIILTL
ncbi:MAG: type I methionyl aminopeptidase [Pseudomonadota bacterium]